MKIPLWAAFCIISLSVSAQEHYNSWFRATVQVPVAGKWSADGELQYRRQNGLNNKNPFGENLLWSFRTRLNYQHSKAIKFSVSPLAYFKAHKTIKTDTDYTAPTLTEYRLAAFVEITEPLSGKLQFRNRETVEYRIFGHNNRVTRLRIFNGLIYTLQKRWEIDGYHELILNVGGVPTTRYLDQSRLGISAIYRCTKHLKIEPGYLHISRFPSGNQAISREHNLVVNLTVAL